MKANKKKHFFRLFSNCIPVKGASRSLICDIQRQDFNLIPNVLFEILKIKPLFEIEELVAQYGYENKETIEEYIDFLVKNEYCFQSDSDDDLLFPELDLFWDEPFSITNSIIDVNSFNYDNIRSIANQLHELGCKNLEIRFFSSFNEQTFDSVLSCFNDTIITNILMYVKYEEELFDATNCLNLIVKNPTVSLIYLHSIQDKREINQNLHDKIIEIENAIDSHLHCGFISQDYFSINLKTFTESQKHNTCLNRKISIDVNGEIKNCPSMTKSYGNIKDTTLKEAIEKAGFKDVWYIHKDQIDVCKDCEFRHICTDCRAYIQDPNNIYSKPAKCSYDPYTATWGEENPTNNPLYGQ